VRKVFPRSSASLSPVFQHNTPRAIFSKHPIDDYNLRIGSDLDNLLKQAAGNVVKSRTAKFEQKLKEAVMEKARGPLAEATASYGDFGAIAEELSARLQTGGKLL
jgi:hypothetical protein